WAGWVDAPGRKARRRPACIRQDPAACAPAAGESGSGHGGITARPRAADFWAYFTNCAAGAYFPLSGTVMEFSQLNVQALMEITQRPDLAFVRGQGSWLEDHAGKRYLDFVQGWAVNCLGHCPEPVTRALAQQGALLVNPSPAFYNLPSIELAQRLTGASCFDRVFFANSGAEANEGAIKLARKYGRVHRDGAYK